jgi:chitodextrinase
MTLGGGLLSKPFKSSNIFAQSAGTWSLAGNTSAAAIHASLMPDGNILYIAGSSYQHASMDGPFKALLLNPNNSSETNVPLTEDLFCCGHAHLANGNVFIAGGTLQFDTHPDNCNGKWHGLKATYEYDVSSKSLAKKSSMTTGRWYPTCVTLPDGKILTVTGYDEYGSVNFLVEIYDPSSQSWSIKYDPGTSTRYCVGGSETACVGAGSPCFGGTNMGVGPAISLYSRMHLLPSGLVITCGPYKDVRSFDPQTGRWNLLANLNMYRHYGTTFLLPLQNTTSEKGKILVVGGSPTSADPATATAQILDFNASGSGSPIIRSVNSIRNARKFMMPVILPDGRCVIFGGSSLGASNYVNSAESFDPTTESWSTLPSATVPRSYHGVAVLLADGRVWTASNAPGRTFWEPRIEIFSPAYYSQSRPGISGEPTVGDYGSNITIPTPDAAIVTSVSLVRLASQTHHYDPNMRLVWLQIVNRTSNSITVSAPINANIAPPGYYMIHVLNSARIPSTAKIIQIPGSGSGGGGGDTTPPSKVLSLTATATSGSQIGLTWTANTEPDLDHYNIYRGTTAGFAVNTTSDTPLAQVTTASYSDTGLTASTTYYYKVAAVDTSNNIGALSDEASATTSSPPDTTPPGQVIGLAVTAASSSQLNLTWTANPQSDGVGHYNVYRGTTANFAVDTATDTPLATPTTNSYSDTGLTASTTYYYKVAAVDTSNNIGALSDEASATTSGPGAIETFYNVAYPGNTSRRLGAGFAARHGEQVYSNTSQLRGKTLKKLVVYLRRVSTPSGNIRAVVRRQSGDTVVATFNEIIQASSLSTAFTQQTFTLTTPYTLATGDKILVEYEGPNGIDISIWNIDKFDAGHTRDARFTTVYSSTRTNDIVGTMSSG